MSGFNLSSLLKQLDDYLEAELEKNSTPSNCFIISPDAGSQRPPFNVPQYLVADERSSEPIGLSLKNNTPPFDGETTFPCNEESVRLCSGMSTSGDTADDATLPGEHIKKKSKAVDIIDPATTDQ